MNSQLALSNQMLQNKLRSKQDLYEYMSSHLNIWLPKSQYCRLSFLQAIIQDKKKYLKASDVKMQNIKDGWHEFAIKNIWKYIENDLVFQEYLPWEEMKEGRYPDKQFVWGIAFTVKHTWAQQYYDMCLKERNKINAIPIQKKVIVVSDAWKEKLAQHEFVSKCKSSKKQSIIIEQEVRPYKKRDARTKINVELYSQDFENALEQNQIIEQPQNIASNRFNFSSQMNQQNQSSLSTNFNSVYNSSNQNPFKFNIHPPGKDSGNNKSFLSNVNGSNILKLNQIQNGQQDRNSQDKNQKRDEKKSKKRRMEEFRELQGEGDQLCTLKNDGVSGDLFALFANKNSPNKSSGKKSKQREEEQE